MKAGITANPEGKGIMDYTPIKRVFLDTSVQERLRKAEKTGIIEDVPTKEVGVLLRTQNTRVRKMIYFALCMQDDSVPWTAPVALKHVPAVVVSTAKSALAALPGVRALTQFRGGTAAVIPMTWEPNKGEKIVMREIKWPVLSIAVPFGDVAEFSAVEQTMRALRTTGTGRTDLSHFRQVLSRMEKRMLRHKGKEKTREAELDRLSYTLSVRIAQWYSHVVRLQGARADKKAL